MTAPAFLRRLEPAVFGTTSQRSWDLRARVRAYTDGLNGGTSRCTGPDLVSPLSAPAPPSTSGRGAPNVTATGALNTCSENQRPGRSLVGEHVPAIETEG